MLWTIFEGIPEVVGISNLVHKIEHSETYLKNCLTQLCKNGDALTEDGTLFVNSSNVYPEAKTFSHAQCILRKFTNVII